MLKKIKKLDHNRLVLLNHFTSLGREELYRGDIDLEI